MTTMGHGSGLAAALGKWSVTTMMAVVLGCGWALQVRAFADTGVVEGRVFADIDRDGRDGAGDTGVGGVRVTLLDRYGRETPGNEMLTGADGSYRFEGVAAGDYRVGFERPAGRYFTGTLVGARLGDGTRVTMHDQPDDSDVNFTNEYRRPDRRGPFATGVVFEEHTRVDDAGEPWPLNFMVFYPAQRVATTPVTVGDLFRHDATDQRNALAIYRDVSGAGAAVGLAGASALQEGIAAVESAPVVDGLHPTVLMSTGLYGSLAQMASLADHLASHGFVVACMESPVVHGSVSLGSRLTRNGGPYEVADFDHIPRVGGASLARLIGHGYDPDGYLTCDVTLPAMQQEAIFAADGMAVLDRLEERAVTAGDPLEGHMDLRGVPYVGYSMGANRSAELVEGDERIILGVSLDSSSGIRTDKPFLWVGRHGITGHQGPKLLVDFPQDAHPLYVQFPGVTLISDIYRFEANERVHQVFRDYEIVSFLRLFGESINGYRHELGVDRPFETFGGLIGPHTLERFPDPMTGRFSVADGATVEADAGLIRTQLFALESTTSRLVAIDAGFLAGTSLTAAAVVDHGVIEYFDGAARRLMRGASALSFDGAGGLYISGRDSSAGDARAVVLRVDTNALIPGQRVVAELVADLGAGGRVRALAVEPATADVFLLVDAPGGVSGGARANRLVLVDAVNGTVRKLGPVRDDASAVTAGAGLEFLEDGTLYAFDNASRRLVRIDPCSGTILATVDADPGQGLGSLRVEGIAWTAHDRTMVMVDAAQDRLGLLTLADGGNLVYGDIAELGLTKLGAIAFDVPRRASASGARLGLAVGSGRRRHVAAGQSFGVLGAAAEVAHPERAAGGRLEVRHVDGTRNFGLEVIEVAERGAVRLGDPISLDFLDDPFARTGLEVVHGGTVIGWLASNGTRVKSGTKHRPLSIRLAANPSAEALAQLVEAIDFRCAGCAPGERALELRIERADGTSGNSVIIRHPVP